MSRKHDARAFLIGVLLGCSSLSAKETPQLAVYFSPAGGCTQAICETLARAKKEIFVQAYSFTSAPITKALIEAARRGVHVEVILDKSQQGGRYSGATALRNAGIPVCIDSAHRIAHNKVMLIDGSTVITGSFNFTKAAEQSNAENLLIIRTAAELASTYLVNWKAHKKHSSRLERTPFPL